MSASHWIHNPKRMMIVARRLMVEAAIKTNRLSNNGSASEAKYVRHFHEQNARLDEATADDWVRLGVTSKSLNPAAHYSRVQVTAQVPNTISSKAYPTVRIIAE